MSMSLAFSAVSAPVTGYQVPAPCKGDVLSGTLRRAYGDPVTAHLPFADLIAELDRIALPRR